MTRRFFIFQTLAGPSLLTPAQSRSAREIVELLATATLNLDYASGLPESTRLVFSEARLRGKPAYRLTVADQSVGYILRQRGREQIGSIRIHRTLVDPFGRRRILVAVEVVLS
jgi:hypothetical protein